MVKLDTPELEAAWIAEYPDHIHDWFGLSYASYLVLPRLVLSKMPPEWQVRFLGMLGELEAEFGHAYGENDYSVQLRDEAGRFMSDPLANYRHGRIPDRPGPEDPGDGVAKFEVGDRVRFLPPRVMAGKCGTVEVVGPPSATKWTGHPAPRFLVKMDDFGHTWAHDRDLELIPSEPPAENGA